MSSFTVKAAPGTDIWRKPPTKDIFNAPTHAPAGTKTTGPLSSFRSATVSFSFLPREQYDQGGVVLSFTSPGDGDPSSPSPKKWVKSGIELLNGLPVLGTVACDAWADWSLAPVPNNDIFTEAGRGSTTLLLQKEGDENGVSLWVHLVNTDNGGKVALREVCWVFAPDMEGWEVKVEAYAARPAKGTEEELEVEFGGLDVVWE